MIGNSTQRRERLQAHVLSLHPDEQAASPTTPKAASTPEYADLHLRLGLALLSWLTLLFLNLALHLTYFHNISERLRIHMPFASMLLATPVIFFCVYPILRAAARGLLLRTFCPELLLSLAVLSAYLFGLRQTFRGSSQTSFDTAIVLVTFFLAAKLVARNAKQKPHVRLPICTTRCPSKFASFATAASILSAFLNWFPAKPLPSELESASLPMEL